MFNCKPSLNPYWPRLKRPGSRRRHAPLRISSLKVTPSRTRQASRCRRLSRLAPDCGQACDEDIDVVMFRMVAPRGLAEPETKFRVLDQSAKGVRKRADVADRHDQPVTFMVDDLGNGAN